MAAFLSCHFFFGKYRKPQKKTGTEDAKSSLEQMGDQCNLLPNPKKFNFGHYCLYFGYQKGRLRSQICIINYKPIV